MSHSGQRGAWEERAAEAKAQQAEDAGMVRCKNLVYLHQTPKGGVLVQENEELAGKTWRQDGKKTWLPGQACRFTPLLMKLKPGDAVEVVMPKRLADEKEMFYE